MKNMFKTFVTAGALVVMACPAFAEVVRTETVTDTSYITVNDDISGKNTTNRATGRHYSSQSNDYRQPEPLANAQVIALQQELKIQGFYEGKIDGLLGTETKDAIRAYQEANGLPATGNMSTAALDNLGIRWDMPATANGPIVTGVTQTTTVTTHK